MLAFSLAFTGFGLPATAHSLVLKFGELQELRSEWPATMQVLFEPNVLSHAAGPDDPACRDGIGAADFEAMLRWWVGRLNVL